MDKSFSRRLALNSSIFKNPYWVLPVDDVGHSNYEPVGRGLKTSPFCGRWVGLNICKNFEGHEGKFLNGEDCTGKVVNIHRHMWCHKSSCPVCFIRGWSVRGARHIEGRIDTGVKRGLGKAEHIVVGVAIADRDLPEYVFRKKCRDALFDRGVIGGCMIFHGFSVDKRLGKLVWSPHYHVLGFIEGGFDRCRNCVHERGDCGSCSGLKGREVRGYAKDGYLVKVLDERESVFGTAWYQLHHATVRLGVKRFHAVTWFGVCGNRKFASEVVDAKVTCPVCREETCRGHYVGKERIVKDVSDPNYRAVFLMDEFDENGEPNYIDDMGGGGER
jgi:hypothetical protein